MNNASNQIAEAMADESSQKQPLCGNKIQHMDQNLLRRQRTVGKDNRIQTSFGRPKRLNPSLAIRSSCTDAIKVRPGEHA